MSVETIETELVDTKQVLIIQAKEFGVGEETQLSLAEAYKPFLEKAQLWEQQAREIVVQSVDDKEAMKQARTLRLQVKDFRTSLDKKRKEIKHDALQKGKAIDAIAKNIREMFEPTEKYLQEQEDYAKILREKEVARLQEERKAQLVEYNFESSFIQLGEMKEEDYATLLSTAKAAHDAKIKAEQEAAEAERKRIEEEAEKERQRIAAEKAERERVEAENARLKKEREEREAQIEKERLEREEREAAERAEREAAEAKRQAEEAARLEAERKEREKAEAEAKTLREAEERRQREAAEKKRLEEEARQKALQASDKEKLEKLLVDIAAIDLPDMESQAAKKVLASAASFLDLAKDQIVTGLPTM